MISYNKSITEEELLRIKKTIESGRYPSAIMKTGHSLGNVGGVIGEISGNSIYFWSNARELSGSSGAVDPSVGGKRYAWALDSRNLEFPLDIDIFFIPTSDKPNFVLLINGGKQIGLAETKEEIGEYLIESKEEDVKVFKIGEEVKPEVKVTFE